ncbi:hypothetical protein GCM10025734_78740 [Kitasatospora paranensis]
MFTAAGLWPLLAALADGADGTARRELADAVGVPAEGAAGHARELIAALRRLPGVGAAIGLWTKPGLPVSASWTARLPADVHEVLATDGAQARLDAWAARHSNGLVESFPLEVTEDTQLVLASALAVRTEWLRPFVPSVLCPEAGPWAERAIAALYRRTALLDRLAVADTPAGPVSELRVLGTGGIDVHLLLGEETAAPGQVLSAGLGLLARRHPRVTGDLLPYGTPGPGVTVSRSLAYRPEQWLDVVTPRFTVAAGHDLLRSPRTFGLVAASCPDRGHFPGIAGDFPLAVEAAAQNATASFSARGFRAAAISAIAVAAGGIPPKPPYRVREVEFRVDRPFGFLAVHRTSRLVLAAGWVERPDEEPSGLYDSLEDGDGDDTDAW